MIPRSVDINTVVASLSDAAVYIDPRFPEAEKVDQRELQSVIDDAKSGASKEKFGNVKIALIREDLSLTATRDVAQKIKDETDANTVVVKSLSQVATVADNFSRYNIESNAHKAYETPTAVSLQSYVHALEEHRDPEVAVNATGLIALIVSIALGAAATRILAKTSQVKILDSP